MYGALESTTMLWRPRNYRDIIIIIIIIHSRSKNKQKKLYFAVLLPSHYLSPLDLIQFLGEQIEISPKNTKHKMRNINSETALWISSNYGILYNP